MITFGFLLRELWVAARIVQVVAAYAGKGETANLECSAGRHLDAFVEVYFE